MKILANQRVDEKNDFFLLHFFIVCNTKYGDDKNYCENLNILTGVGSH